MPNPARLLRRGPKIKAEEVEAARSYTLARLSAIFDVAPETIEAPVTPTIETPVEAAIPEPVAVPIEVAPEPVAVPVKPARAVRKRTKKPVPIMFTAPAEEVVAEVVVAEVELDAVELDAVVAEQAVEPEETPAVVAEAPLPPIEATEVAEVAEPVDEIWAADEPIAAASELVVTEGWYGADGFVPAPVDPLAPVEIPSNSVPVMAELGSPLVDSSGWDIPIAVVSAVSGPRYEAVAAVAEPAFESVVEPANEPPYSASVRASEPPPEPVLGASEPVAAALVGPTPEPFVEEATEPSAESEAVGRTAARPRRPAPPRPVTRPTAMPAAMVASCPYCAVILDPAPEADRRCRRCRQKIVVRRVQGRPVYLTEAAVEIFESERLRVANGARWTRERERWLKLASSVEAPAGRIARLERAVLSDKVVAESRAVYEATVDRLVRSAKHEHRWDDAARLRRDQAVALHRMAGSPVPAPAEVVALHREGSLASLRGLGEIAREAELVSADCCEVCRSDAGSHFRISMELREPRLPHAGCEKGLCRCRWELTSRDRNVIGSYLRRHSRSDRLAPSA